MQATAVVRQFTGIPVNDCRPAQSRMTLLLRDLLAIRWHDISDDRLFTGFSTYTAILGNWYSPGATAIEGDNVEVSEFQFGIDRAVPAISVLLTELGLPSLVAARQLCVQMHIVSPPLGGRIDDLQAGSSFSGQIWANYSDSQNPDYLTPLSRKDDVLTYLELVLELLEAFDACPKIPALTVPDSPSVDADSLYAVLVEAIKSRPLPNFKKWLDAAFVKEQLRVQSLRLHGLKQQGTAGAREQSSLKGVYVVIRLLLFATTNWFALCESDSFKIFLSRKLAHVSSRGRPFEISYELLITPARKALQDWTQRLLEWLQLRRSVGAIADPVLECAFLTLAYTCSRIGEATNPPYTWCRIVRPDIAMEADEQEKAGVQIDHGQLWTNELRLEDNRHFPFEQTLHFWRLHDFYSTHKAELLQPTGSGTTKKADDACLRRWRELANLWLATPADAQMMAAPFIIDAMVPELNSKLEKNPLYDVQRRVLASASFAPSPRAWLRSLGPNPNEQRAQPSPPAADAASPGI
jgi:hypothetical protein